MARRSTRLQAAEPAQPLASPPPTPAPQSKRSSKKNVANAASPKLKEENKAPATPAQTKSRKRARSPNKVKAEDDEELPHNLSGGLPTPATDEEPPAKRNRGGNKKTPVKQDPADMEEIAKNAGIIDGESPDTKSKASKAKSPKKPNYKLTPGSSPYPDYIHPTPEECAEVVRILSKEHGKVQMPKEISAPSLTTAGCGEVPSVLDALIRTRLSAATTGLNSSRAFQSLVKTFGTIKSGVGAGSVDWNAVRLASQKQVFEAIKCGGLADSKSKDIKAILDSVHEENQSRAAAIKSESDSAPGEDHESEAEKKKEVAGADSQRLSLDHLHLLTDAEAFNHLVAYPGIGPKTASCVLLFCLRRPSFAVDTHVFRLCQWLGWVPSDAEAKENKWPKVERNTTYSHCEVRIPDEHKYALHQLLIKHGKSCGRCRAATGMGSEGWKKGCPIEHLVHRLGAKKGGMEGGAKKRGRKGEDSESEEAEMSGVGSEEEDDEVSEEEEDDE